MPRENSDDRPDADELPGRIPKAAKGKLTVFFGAAAGVGKTYTMLEAAQQCLAEGMDVVSGWIETHGRAETERLVAGLPCIAPQIILYRDKEIKEMDIDAILARKPDLVIVDELAHTNILGSRHVRRYQDIEELLNAGINVYTTLSIQHIESLNDVVTRITGVIVRETVPDYIVERADTVQLIDIPPEELIKRLKEGKVYVPGQVEQALKKFFRPGNINALRELALRFTASRVDKDLAQYMREHNIEGPWPAAGRIMVCVSASPFSAQLIRAARRLSGGLQAELLAVHIEAPTRRYPMGEKERDRVVRNLRLAEELGAQTLTIVGENLVNEILEVARSHNVTAIVVGRPQHSRLWELRHGSLVDKLIRHGGGINVYVIQGKAEEEERPAIKTAPPAVASRPLWHYCGGLSMMVAVTILSWLFKAELELVNIALLYVLPVLLAAAWWGRWPSYVTAVASVLAFDFLFVSPIFTFSVSDIRYVWSFIIFLFVSFVSGGRTELLRLEAKSARQREKRTRALYEFSRGIAAVINLEAIAKELARHAGETIGSKTMVLLPDDKGYLAMAGFYDPARPDSFSQPQPLLEAENAVASWAYQHRQVAGRSTETLPGRIFFSMYRLLPAARCGVSWVYISLPIKSPLKNGGLSMPGRDWRLLLSKG
ncbi:MAG TPA: DUF4118 domain-containing protein [Methylomusa anaerophila]|uniref:Sensor protein KdpD n=1 Tax=Methylomusa anaerophila TaxID=1930071 RepID=A0A348AMM9_9FIRM|nr:DUF4118 domain-containing protein [Methylomusa anaerophila]BBB92327.1 sensor protein KdpD [Methylomusa anaerophila]HML90033.1 DUF4118 domain-containing protein [Methylomusa anaerophila]